MTNLQRATIGGLAFAALALASCSTQRPVPRPAVPSQPGRAPDAAEAASYVATAGSIDLFVVRASDLALERSNDGRVRALATQLGEEHRGLGAQLSLAGRRVNALPAARMLPREEQRFATVVSSASFDAAYVRQISQAHEQSLALHAAFAARGSSPTLRPVAANGERVEREHLAALRGF